MININMLNVAFFSTWKVQKTLEFALLCIFVCGKRRRSAVFFLPLLRPTCFVKARCSMKEWSKQFSNSETCPCQRGGEQKEDWEWGFTLLNPNGQLHIGWQLNTFSCQVEVLGEKVAGVGEEVLWGLFWKYVLLSNRVMWNAPGLISDQIIWIFSRSAEAEQELKRYSND